jgi:hypothetical protein
MLEIGTAAHKCVDHNGVFGIADVYGALCTIVARVAIICLSPILVLQSTSTTFHAVETATRRPHPARENRDLQRYYYGSSFGLDGWSENVYSRKWERGAASRSLVIAEIQYCTGSKPAGAAASSSRADISTIYSSFCSLSPACTCCSLGSMILLVRTSVLRFSPFFGT